MENHAVIIDNGSGMLKAGFSGEETPRTVFPQLIGKPRQETEILDTLDKEFYIGYEAVEHRE